MTSCSSHERPSMHPYCDEQHQSQTSLQSMESRRRSLFSWVMGTFQRENLPPLPEGACLSSSSPRPPALPPMLFNPPHLGMRTTLLITRSNSSWATTAGPSLPGVTPATVLGIPGFQLQHPQSHSTQATFGTTFSSPTAPTSPQEPVLLTTELLPQTATAIPITITGISLYETRSSHSSLYQKLRSPSPDPPFPTAPPGKTLMSDTSHLPPDPTRPATQPIWRVSQVQQVAK